MEQMKSLPYNYTSESALLGTIIKNNNIFMEIIDIIKADDFYKTIHGEIYNAMYQMMKEGLNIDILSLANEMNKLTNTSTLSLITELENSVSTYESKNYMYHVEQMKSYSARRKMIKTYMEGIESAYNLKSNIDDIQKESIKELSNISANLEKDDNTILAPQLMENWFNTMEQRSKNKNTIQGIETGYVKFDSVINGLNKGELIIMAGRPAMGKTAFALNIGLNVIKQDKSVGVFSLEMPQGSLTDRMVSAQTLISQNKIKSSQLNDEEWSKVANASNLIASKKLFINDTASLTIREMKKIANKFKLQYGLDVLIIDYLQLIKAEIPNKIRVQEVSEISRDLKILARELDITVICLSQLSRAVEGRADKRPMLSDLRESGSIEQDADIVVFLYRDEYYNSETEDKMLAEIIISKNRNGEIGFTKLAWLSEYQKFANPDIKR